MKGWGEIGFCLIDVLIEEIWVREFYELIRIIEGVLIEKNVIGIRRDICFIWFIIGKCLVVWIILVFRIFYLK